MRRNTDTLRARPASGPCFARCFTNIVIDEAEGKVSTEQSCPHVKPDGTLDHVITCNFFDVDPASGLFTRVIVWIDGVSPLRD